LDAKLTAATPDGNQMSFLDQAIPVLSDAIVPPVVRGTGDLTDFAYQGNDYDALMQRVDSAAANNPAAAEAAQIYDAAIAAQLAFRRADGLSLQDAALEQSQIYRIGDPSGGALRPPAHGVLRPPAHGVSRPPAHGVLRPPAHGVLRLLALAGPGDLMTNTPLDFLTNHLNVRLDVLYMLPDRPLPPVIPDHDLAFFSLSEADPATLSRLRRLYAIWPRPALNDPRFLPAMERDNLSRSLAGVPGLCSPTAVATTRTALDQHLGSGRPLEGFDGPDALYPCLIRPAHSHAGTGLCRVANPAELAAYLRTSFERQFFVTAFEDYRGPDGLYRKSRIAFIDRQPFLCHLAISANWMVHYLNAGMTESEEKRAEEAAAMASFDTGFARRHASAFDALHQRLGFDYYSIDCAETQDGRLLVFEADAAAIIHLMDPPALFPYKQPQMRKVFAAFEAMLRRRAHQG
jgi:hypothetical protein